MSIVIVDDFQMNANKPIDNRIVVGSQSFYKNKNSIDNKYNGLRIWDLNDNIPYYWNGATWSSENAIGVIVDSTPVNKSEVSYIPKFTSGSTIIGKSKIYDNVVNIGIGVTGSAIVTNLTLPINLGLALNQNANETGLHVAGNIRTNRHFIGNGEYIQNINASNINGGVGAGGRLGIQWIQSKVGSVSNTDYVLINKNNNNTWEDFSTKVNSVISVSNINITDDTTSTTDKLLTFVSSTGNSPINVSSTKLKFRPSTGQLFLSDGSSTSPVYSFLNSLNTGMYYNPTSDSVKNLGFSVEGSEIMRLSNYGVNITKGRLYIPFAVNTGTDSGLGLIFSNNINLSDVFTYEGYRLNNYGIGSHIPTLSTIPSGRGIYIAGYFGVDIFSGGRLKVKVDQNNDLTINSRLNISNTHDTLGGTIGNNVVLSTMTNMGGSLGNTVVIKDWSVRADWQQTPNTSAVNANDWFTWKHHNGIAVDGIFNTPNGPSSGYYPVSGTLTFWERHPYIHEQYFGSINEKTLTINSGLTDQFVKVDGNLLVGGTSTLLPCALANFSSTTKGIIPPRLTAAERSLINSPVEGLTVYNTTSKHMEVYDGTNWVGLSTIRVDTGSVVTNTRFAQAGWNGWANSLYNYAFVYPPTGYTTQNLLGFIPSIEYIDFSGTVSGDDYLYCRYAIDHTYNRIRVWCQNSENDSESRFQYMAIYQK